MTGRKFYYTWPFTYLYDLRIWMFRRGWWPSTRQSKGDES